VIAQHAFIFAFVLGLFVGAGVAVAVSVFVDMERSLRWQQESLQRQQQLQQGIWLFGQPLIPPTRPSEETLAAIRGKR
jgi:hypothetical protein